MPTKEELLVQRNSTEKIKNQDNSTKSTTTSETQLNPMIIRSWERASNASISKALAAAPLQLQKRDTTSTLDQVITKCASELQNIAEQSSMIMAICDTSSTLLWTASSTHMQSRAESVHFIAGGQWGEQFVGTNAIGLSLTTQQSSSVFSSEHYIDSIQNWVCYATPIIDPYSKQILGVVDLSTTWDRHNPLGILAVERCAAIIQSALQEQQKEHLYIRAFSSPQVIYNKKIVALPHRQIEILAILTLCKQGLSLDQLHHALYGERKISINTLKAEISQLRQVLGPMLGSRPYRLIAEVEADFLQAEQALDNGLINAAFRLYTGVFLAKTESPFLSNWRNYLESRLSDAIFKSNETDMLFKYISRTPEAIDAIDRLIELLPSDHPAHQKTLKFTD